MFYICDSDMKIIAANARFPGSVHDAAIWQLSDIRTHLLRQYNNGLRNMYLIGINCLKLSKFDIVFVCFCRR